MPSRDCRYCDQKVVVDEDDQAQAEGDNVPDIEQQYLHHLVSEHYHDLSAVDHRRVDVRFEGDVDEILDDEIPAWKIGAAATAAVFVLGVAFVTLF